MISMQFWLPHSYKWKNGPVYLITKSSTIKLITIFFPLPVDPPVVTQHPVSQLVSTGAETVTFKIEATGDDLTFQWQKNGSDLHSDSNYSGTDTHTLKIRHVKKSDAGHYRCLVKNQVEKDGKLSKEAELIVCKYLYVAVPNRNRILFRCIFRAHH